MPVVWCTDPNSSNKKPTAFALHGIQLQGNISEQHVLAVRELINAAAEGRLLLPTDGGIVLLDCGVGVGSVIIQDNNSLERDSNKENERSRAVNDIVQQKMLHNSENNIKVTKMKKSHELDHLQNEILYEFLCCARCMNEGVKCCNRSSQSLKIVAKYLDSKIGSGRGNRRLANVKRTTNNRRKNVVSFKSEKRPLRRIQSSVMLNKIPIYATVNKQQKQKNRKHQQIDHPDRNSPIVVTANDVIESNELLVTVAGTGRKTSFDSTCTVSSMDSGFIEMQNKLEIAKKAANTKREAKEIEIKIDASEEADMVDGIQNVTSTWNRLTIPSQSRNRRKSYEEFKSLFSDHQKFSPSTEDNRPDAKSSIKSRRKSYEEFKSATNILCDSNSTNNCKSSCKTINNDLVINNAPSAENSGNFLSKMKRKNSKRISTRKTKFDNKTVNQKIDEDVKSPSSETGLTIYDILKKTCNDNIIDADKTDNKYDKNLELFKSHCSKNNIKDFDNLLSCGTIYDIIQRKSDFYTKNFKRYDKYMTYGTLYEILHRKTDEDDQFERQRTLSEKVSTKRINYAHIDFKSQAENDNSEKISAATDTNSQHLNSTSTTTSASSLKQGSYGANNQLSITSVGSQQLSTIYDILQTKKLETTTVNPAVSMKGRNRFLVRKITEEDLIEARKEDVEVKAIDIKEVCENKTEPITQIVEPFKKQNRIRRFSNILSYSPKVSNDTDKTSSLKVPTVEVNKKTNVHLEAKIDELYSRLNRITQQHENQQLATKIETEKEPKIYKTNSLDMLSALKEENEGLNTKQRPFRKISVPTHLPMKVLPKKSTRRLSEFTRGEFLNEKS